jgi:hypothetical protein
MALGLLGSYLSSSSEDDDDDEETKVETKEEEKQTQILSNPFGADSSSSISRAGPSYLLEVHVRSFFIFINV